MYLVLIFLPLLASIVAGFGGRKVGVRGAQILTSLGVILSTVLAVLAFYEVALCNSPVYLRLFPWMDLDWLYLEWAFQFDSLTVAMLIPVLIISSCVHLYSVSYMSNDPHLQRFFSYLSLFTFMMILLVTSNNYCLMFVGWEGVGVMSFLLVSFWFTRISANQSSISAFLTNRVGDTFLTVGMITILWSFGNLDYATVFSLSPYVNESSLLIMGICLLIGAMAKSAQLGLHVWLPLAMEGPTPVSALIHAATMVTAGVYLLMRSSPLLEYSSTLLLLCLWLGAVTSLFSSLVGLFQLDIKKVIAYSTMSQLGMMVIAIGLSSYNLALFHLINHAFYKALLFLAAGSVIHASLDNQDMRKYGSLASYLPFTYSVFIIASLSLVAFPFLSGFYSKDFILESAFSQRTFSSLTCYIFALTAALSTTLYSVKVIYLTFLQPPQSSSRLNYGYRFPRTQLLSLKELKELEDGYIKNRHERESLYQLITGRRVTTLRDEHELLQPVVKPAVVEEAEGGAGGNPPSAPAEACPDGSRGNLRGPSSLREEASASAAGSRGGLSRESLGGRAPEVAAANPPSQESLGGRAPEQAPPLEDSSWFTSIPKESELAKRGISRISLGGGPSLLPEGNQPPLPPAEEVAPPSMRAKELSTRRRNLRRLRGRKLRGDYCKTHEEETTIWDSALYEKKAVRTYKCIVRDWYIFLCARPVPRLLLTHPLIFPPVSERGDHHLFMTIPLTLLALFSIFFGYMTKEMFVGVLALPNLDNSLFILPQHELYLSMEFSLPLYIKWLPFFFTLAATILFLVLQEGYLQRLLRIKFTAFGYSSFAFLNQRFFLDSFYNHFILNRVLDLGHITSQILDKGTIESLGPFGLEKALVKLSKALALLHTSQVTIYALYLLLAFLLFITVLFMPIFHQGYYLALVFLASTYLLLDDGTRGDC